ncbi:hypothetical protein H5410_060070 [Solanum commersonii]|uniref:Uncharacterized protein n=1 Tax=Solanum commersonii TaxID=4109 RepID=A0A9J5W4W7_SOLCO|nr:hypothetical protein H5410_060070 [Solanum commersonii]
MPRVLVESSRREKKRRKKEKRERIKVFVEVLEFCRGFLPWVLALQAILKEQSTKKQVNSTVYTEISGEETVESTSMPSSNKTIIRGITISNHQNNNNNNNDGLNPVMSLIGPLCQHIHEAHLKCIIYVSQVYGGKIATCNSVALSFKLEMSGARRISPYVFIVCDHGKRNILVGFWNC